MLPRQSGLRALFSFRASAQSRRAGTDLPAPSNRPKLDSRRAGIATLRKEKIMPPIAAKLNTAPFSKRLISAFSFGTMCLATFSVGTMLLPSAGRAQLPGSTASFKFATYPTGAAVGTIGTAATWATTPAGAGTLDSELLQIGHSFPSLVGTGTVVLSSLANPDPPIQTRGPVFGPLPFGIGVAGVGNTGFGVYFGFGQGVADFSGLSIFAPLTASKVADNGIVVLKNTSMSTVPATVGEFMHCVGFALRPAAFSASAIGANISLKFSPAPPTVWTPSLLAAASSGTGPSYFGSGGLGPSPASDSGADFFFKTGATYFYSGYRLKTFSVPPGGTLTIDASMTHIASGAVAAGFARTPISELIGAGAEEFYTLPGLPAADFSADGSRGAGVMWLNQSFSGDWGNPVNWNPNSVPIPQANLIFATPGINNGGFVNLNGNRQAGAIVFFNENGQYTLDNVIGLNTLTLSDQSGNGLIENWSDSSPQINCNLQCFNTLTVRTVIDTQHTMIHGFVDTFQLELKGAGYIDFLSRVNTNSITTADSGTTNFGGQLSFTSATIDRSATVNIGGPQTHPSGSLLSVIYGTVNMYSDAGAVGSANLSVNVTATGGDAAMNFNSTQHLAALSVTGGTATATPGGGKVLVVTSVSTGGSSSAAESSKTGETGKIDLNDNSMIVDYTGSSPLSSIMSQITTGYASGSWNGNGITSSTIAANNSNPANHIQALGYADNTEIGTTTFAGQMVDPTSVLIRTTLSGDANLNGAVDTIDFNLLAVNFAQSGRDWYQGDFDYSGTVDTVDFNLLASNFGQVLPAPSVGVLIPEPTAIGLLVLPLRALLKRREKRRSSFARR
jgi:hypothetical protein